MSNRINIALLYGGKSGEHEISLRSAASVLANLDAERYVITPIGIDKEGNFFINEFNSQAIPESLPVKTSTSRVLDSLVRNGKFALDVDVVFPVLHGPLYEDGCIQGLLELADVAYVGAGVLASAMGMDKDIARRIVCTDDIQCTRYRRLSWRQQKDNLEVFCHKVIADLGWPMFVKPCTMGSSVGIHKVKNLSELMNAISDARRYDDEVLVEARVIGREIELAVIENINPLGSPKVSVPGEVCVFHPNGFYSYTAKYIESDQTLLKVPANLDTQLVSRLQQMAADIFIRLKCRGMARVDFFVNDNTGQIYFSEINTLPGFTTISMYPKMWVESGLSYSALIDELIALAIRHRQYKDQLVTHYQ